MIIFSTKPRRVCMQFQEIGKLATTFSRNKRRAVIEKSLSRKEIANLLFDKCLGCQRMAIVPQGAFATRKVRQNQERAFMISKMAEKGSDNESKGNGYSTKSSTEVRELTPLKYNSKLMNSIWGLYNRYSVHNFKKNTDANDGAIAAAWGALINFDAPPATTTASVVATVAAKTAEIFRSGNGL
ncbi:uncharacterized protein LOC107267100 [Cephus cinctus]|uniref:Uncharacterized protein LOC107267100 n=1 Tax=Cephus cinctus TaxID=211228 RepID=A0AAJ7BTF8_CEPCN|nr:uncharacterized protein LOC107267100 [Cephus cinctus]